MTILEPDTLRGGLAVIEVAFQTHEKGCTTDYDITIYGQFEMRINVDGCCVRGCGHTTSDLKLTSRPLKASVV